MALEPQAALETAVRDAIRSTLGYTQRDCERMYDGRPAPTAGDWFVSVWSPSGRSSSSRTCLDEQFSVHVTLTARVALPYDRRLRIRDELERRINAIRALIHKDNLNWSILRAANTLADLSHTNNTKSVGFCESLMLEGLDPLQEVGGDWFSASGSQAPSITGLVQTARFGAARLVQALSTAR